jgi:hypothetical protein
VPFNPAQLFLKNVSMLSATSTTRRQLADCLALVARGAVKPIVSLALPLEEAAQAHALMEAGKAAGRIVPAARVAHAGRAIAGIGCSAFARAARQPASARGRASGSLADAGLGGDVGLSIHPAGRSDDYDRVAEAFGLDIAT